MRPTLLSPALLSLTFALCATGVHAETAGYHELLLNLPDHAKIAQAFSKTTAVNKNGVVQSATAVSAYLNDVTRTPDGFEVVKTQTAFKLASDGADKAPQTDSDRLNAVIAKAAAVGEMTYAADTSLSPVDIENWDEVKARASAVLSEALGPQSEAVFNNIYGLFDSRTAAGAFAKEDVFLAIPHNTGGVVGQANRTESEQAAPIGGGTLKFVTTLTLARWDDATHEAEIDYTSAPDPASLQAYLQAAMPTVLKAGGVTDDGTIQAMIKQMSLEKSTSCHYVADTITSLVKTGDCTVIAGVTAGGQSQVTTETYALSETLQP